MNILIFPSWYPSPEAPSHGIFVRRHAQAIALNHRVTVLYAKAIQTTDTEETEQEQGNLKEHFLFYPKVQAPPLLGGWFKLRAYLRAYKQLLKKTGPIDLVHVHVAFPAGLVILYLLRRRKMPVLLTEHWSGYYPEDGNYRGLFLRHITRRLIRRASSVSVISEKLKLSMLRHRLINRYHLIHNVVDTHVFKPIAGPRSSSGPLKLLHVSSLVEREKNISGILRVAIGLQIRGIPFELNIIGANPEEEPEHRSQVEALRLQGQVHFLGHQPPEAVAKAMQEHDVFLLLSHFEGMPVVVLEAMACGLPVLATPVGAVPSMIQEHFGIVLPEANAEKLCIGYLAVFRELHWASKEDMHQWVQAEYSPEAVAKQFDRQYREALNV